MFEWAAAHGHEVLGDEDGVIAETVVDDRALRFVILGPITVGTGVSDQGQVLIHAAVELRDRTSGQVLERLDQPVYLQGLFPGLPRPDPQAPPFPRWRAEWRAYLGRKLAARYRAAGATPMPMDLVGDGSRDPLFLIGWWLLEGRDPLAAPPRFVPAPGSVERARAQLTSCELELPDQLPPVRASFELGRWTIIALDDGALNTWVFLASDDDAPAVTLVRPDDEPQNRCLYTVDGDPAAMRVVLRWLADLSMPGDPALARWFELRAANHDPDEPLYDPRLSLDRLVDEEVPYWDAHDDYLPPPDAAEVARIRQDDVPRYYAFVRELIDPTFVGRLER